MTLPSLRAVAVASATSTTTTTTTMTTPTSPPSPVDFRQALTERLMDELGDEATALAVVAGLDDQVLDQIEQAVDGDAASPDLAFVPSRVPDDVDSLVVFAFGNRIADDGALLPGPTNEALAEITASFVSEHAVPVFAQWEVAALLVERGVPGVVSIDPDVGDDGAPVYLSTAGIAAKAVALAEAAGMELGHVGVIAHADHAVQCIMNARRVGMTADVPEGVPLPAAYDAESGQPWTRDRPTYVSTDLLGRLLAGT